MPVNNFGIQLKSNILAAQLEQGRTIDPTTVDEVVLSAWGQTIENYITASPDAPQWAPTPDDIQTYTINPAQNQRRSVVELQWIAVTTPADITVTEYNVFRATEIVGNPGTYGPFESIGVVQGGSDTTFIDDTVFYNNTYRYRIVAVSSTGGRSLASDTREIATEIVTVPDAPTDKIITKAGSLKVGLLWDQSLNPNFDVYIIQRRETDAILSQDGTYSIPTIPAWKQWEDIIQTKFPEHVDLAVSYDKGYQYRYRILDLNGLFSPYNSDFSETLLSDPVIPNKAFFESQKQKTGYLNYINPRIAAQTDDFIRVHRLPSSINPKFHKDPTLSWPDIDDANRNGDLWYQTDSGQYYFFNGVTKAWEEDVAIGELPSVTLNSISSDLLVTVSEKLILRNHFNIISGDKFIINAQVNTARYPNIVNELISFEAAYTSLVEFLTDVNNGIFSDETQDSVLVDALALPQRFQDYYLARRTLMDKLIENFPFIADDVISFLRTSITNEQFKHNDLFLSGQISTNPGEFAVLTSLHNLSVTQYFDLVHWFFPELATDVADLTTAYGLYDSAWGNVVSDPGNGTFNTNFQNQLSNFLIAIENYSIAIENYLVGLPVNTYYLHYHRDNYIADLTEPFPYLGTSFIDFIRLKFEWTTQVYTGNSSDLSTVTGMNDGDLFLDTQMLNEYIYEQGTTSWVQLTGSEYLHAFRDAGGLMNIFFVDLIQPMPSVYQEGDLLIFDADRTIGTTQFFANRIYESSSARSTGFVEADWFSASEYVDSSTFSSYYDIYFNEPSGYKIDDIWIPNNDFTIDGTLFQRNKTYIAVNPFIASIKSSDWQEFASFLTDLERIQEENEAILATFSDLFSDDKLTPFEKNTLSSEWSNIENENPILLEQAADFEADSTNYTNAFNSLQLYLFNNPGVLLNLNETSNINGDQLLGLFELYYAERLKLQKAINESSKDLERVVRSLNTLVSFSGVDSFNDTPVLKHRIPDSQSELFTYRFPQVASNFNRFPLQGNNYYIDKEFSGSAGEFTDPSESLKVWTDASFQITVWNDLP
jgi:hypothetical protein